MYHTYILFSKKTQKYYTGQTANLKNRLQEPLFEGCAFASPMFFIGYPYLLRSR